MNERIPLEEWKAKKQAERETLGQKQLAAMESFCESGKALSVYLYGRGRLGSRLSSGNAALVLHQIPLARAVYPMRTWNQNGRYVNKGAKGITVLSRKGNGKGYYVTEQADLRPGGEYGTARWGNAKSLNRKYRDRRHPRSNYLFTQNVRMGMDSHKHRHNLNVMVIGGSGAGKTRFYVKPNLMQSICSYIVLDPKGEILRDLGGMFEAQGIAVTVIDLVHFKGHYMGGISQAMVSLPGEVQTAIENVGFLASIPLWLVTILGSLFITVLSFIMILTVYGRFFRLYMYTALAPIPLATFAGDSTQSVGVAFLKTYVGVCMEGAVIVLACIIYAGFVGTPVVATGEATTMVWSYLAETVFNMLVLVGLIKGSDRIIHEMMGL